MIYFRLLAAKLYIDIAVQETPRRPRASAHAL